MMTQQAKTLHERIAHLYGAGVEPAEPWAMASDIESLTCIALAAQATTANINVEDHMQVLLEVIGGLAQELCATLEPHSKQQPKAA